MSEDEKFPWPDKYLDPFEVARPPDENRVFNACMDADPTWERYMRGYRTGAELLFRYLEMTGERGHNDVVVYPLVFCWRHYLELALKQTVSAMRELTGKVGRADLSEHHLMPFWEEIRPHLPSFGAPPGNVTVVGRTLQYLNRFDRGSFAFRYPTTTAGESTQANIPAHINLRRLHEVMQGIANWLEAGLTEMSAHLQYMTEMEAEYESKKRASYGTDDDDYE
jgi:hypothetical protein